VPADGFSRPTTRDEPPDETRGQSRPVAPDTSAFEAALAAIKAAHTSEAAALRERAGAAELSRVATQVIEDKAIAQLAEATVRVDRAEEAAANAQAREAKAAHDRAWASCEQQAAANRRADVERARADRLEAQAAHEREDFLDAEGRTRCELETVREQIAEAEVHQDRLRAEVDSARAELAEARRTQRTSGRAGGAGLGSGQRGGANEKGIDGDTLAEVCCGHRHRFSFIARRL
jgi:hypothetical protein